MTVSETLILVAKQLKTKKSKRTKEYEEQADEATEDLLKFKNSRRFSPAEFRKLSRQKSIKD